MDVPGTKPWERMEVGEGAKIARVTSMTVSRSNTRHIEAQYIRQETPARYSEPASYALGSMLLKVLLTLTRKFPTVTSTHKERGEGAVQGDQRCTEKPESTGRPRSAGRPVSTG